MSGKERDCRLPSAGGPQPPTPPLPHRPSHFDLSAFVRCRHVLGSSRILLTSARSSATPSASEESPTSCLSFRGLFRLLRHFPPPFFLVRSLLPASSLPGHVGRGRLIRPQGHELLISYQARREPGTVTHIHGRGGSQRAQRVWGNQNRCPRFGHLRPTGP